MRMSECLGKTTEFYYHPQHCMYFSFWKHILGAAASATIASSSSGLTAAHHLSRSCLQDDLPLCSCRMWTQFGKRTGHFAAQLKGIISREIRRPAPRLHGWWAAEHKLRTHCNRMEVSIVPIQLPRNIFMLIKIQRLFARVSLVNRVPFIASRHWNTVPDLEEPLQGKEARCTWVYLSLIL